MKIRLHTWSTRPASWKLTQRRVAVLVYGGTEKMMPTLKCGGSIGAWPAPAFAVSTMLKRFYDIFIGIVTKIVYCGYLLERA
jgi:hypothetical protein